MAANNETTDGRPINEITTLRDTTIYTAGRDAYSNLELLGGHTIPINVFLNNVIHTPGRAADDVRNELPQLSTEQHTDDYMETRWNVNEAIKRIILERHGTEELVLNLHRCMLTVFSNKGGFTPDGLFSPSAGYEIHNMENLILRELARSLYKGTLGYLSGNITDTILVSSQQRLLRIWRSLDTPNTYADYSILWPTHSRSRMHASYQITPKMIKKYFMTKVNMVHWALNPKFSFGGFKNSVVDALVYWYFAAYGACVITMVGGVKTKRYSLPNTNMLTLDTEIGVGAKKADSWLVCELIQYLLRGRCSARILPFLDVDLDEADPDAMYRINLNGERPILVEHDAEPVIERRVNYVVNGGRNARA